MRKEQDFDQGVQQSGRAIGPDEIDQICETVRLFPGLSRQELVRTICEHLGWYTPAGGLKEDACEKLLVKFQEAGMVSLPEKRKQRVARWRIRITEHSEPGQPVCCRLSEVQPVGLQVAEGNSEKQLCNEYLQRYHPLGYKRPIGYRMRYFVESPAGRLGCLLFGGAAKALAVRDRWIGWSTQERLQRLPWVINNTRYLIFPWVQVKNLGSYVLGTLVRQVATDWQSRWGYQPVLAESFVDPAYRGSCYRGAGWQYLGETSGMGLARPGHRYTSSPKRIFVKALRADFRTILCSPLIYEGEKL